MPENTEKLRYRIENIKYPGMKEDYESGMVATQLAHKYDCSRQSVSKYAKELGWKQKRRHHGREKAIVRSLLQGDMERVANKAQIPYTPEEVQAGIEAKNSLQTMADNAVLLANLVNKHLEKQQEAIEPANLTRLATVNKTCTDTLMTIREGGPKADKKKELFTSVVDQILSERDELPSEQVH